MNEEQRRLLLARQTWRATRPTETDVLRAANRIATKFQPRKSLTFGKRVRMVSGALATVAGIAYAGSGGLTEMAGRWGRGGGARALVDEPTATATATPESREVRASREIRSNGPLDPKEGRVGVVPEHLAIDLDMPAPAPLEAAVKPRKKLARAGALSAARARRAESAESRESANSIDRVENPTWADVNAALGALDYRRAESLLLQLAEAWRDADTRAKAHLGLAQLAASRGDCERARVLALGVAAAPGIEMKTVRRALELAVRCAK